jgi:hypothetical protein
MQIRTILRTTLLVVFLCGLGASSARSQTGGGYVLTWSSLDCGSPVSSAGAAYVLAGTTGQSEVGDLAGGAYALHGGFRVGSNVPTDVPPPDVTEGSGPLVFRLHANAPNPFANTTAIAFSLAHEVDVDMRVYDLAGRVVRTVLEQQLGPGRHQVMWDGRDDAGRRVSHGIYMLRLRAGAFEARRKLALVP